MVVCGLLLLTSAMKYLWLNGPVAHKVGASWQLRLGQVAAAEMPQVLTSMPQEARAARTCEGLHPSARGMPVRQDAEAWPPFIPPGQHRRKTSPT